MLESFTDRLERTVLPINIIAFWAVFGGFGPLFYILSGSRWASKVLKMMAQYPKIESMGSTGSFRPRSNNAKLNYQPMTDH